MGNRAKRVAAAAALKRAGLGKLYGRPKLAAYELLAARSLEQLTRILGFAVPGLVVHDCAGTNFTVKRARGPQRHYTLDYTGRGGCGWVAVVDQLEFEEGPWSCGCTSSPDPEVSRAEIEGRWLSSSDDEIARRDALPMSMTSRRSFREQVDHLRAGGHVLDERGRYLPEWAWYGPKP